MNKGSKVTVTILLIFFFLIVGIFLQEAGVSKTFIALFALGLFYGIRKMWKKTDEKSSTEIKLNKEK